MLLGLAALPQGRAAAAKAMVGIIDFIRTGRIERGSTVVFVHTGGTAESFAYNAEIVQHLNETT